MRVTTAADAQWQPGPPDRILGDARVSLLDIPREDSELTAIMVDLKDGARATWHSHPCGQILVAFSGLGQVQAEGGDVVDLRPGDSIWARPGERHWHGAIPGHDFTYASIQLHLRLYPADRPDHRQPRRLAIGLGTIGAPVFHDHEGFYPDEG